MENNLTRNERLIEDGHTTRAIDQIEDELKFVIDAKKEFLNAVKLAVSALGKVADTDSIVASEEAFDEMLYPKWAALMEEHRATGEDASIDTTYPESAYMQAWRVEAAKKFRAQPTRGMAPTNPATLGLGGKGEA